MKKKLLVAVAAALIVLLLAFAVLNLSFRKITVISGKQYVDKCPHYARPGQEVTVTTVVVCDAEICVNGTDGSYVSPGVYVFTMPDEDVLLKVTVISDPNGA